MNSELLQKIQLVKANIPLELQENFHLESVSNFIYHLDNIENIRTRNRVAIEIDKYLDQILAKDISTLKPQEEFKMNFANTIHNLSSIYSNDVGFISKPFYPFNISFWVILLILSYFFFDNYILFGIILLASISRAIYIYLKIKARKYH